MFQRLIFLFLTLALSVELINAQNVIQNDDFENYTTCPTGSSPTGSQIPPNWNFTLLGNSTDYFNNCMSCTSSSGCVNPINNYFGSQSPHSGNAYAGILAFTKVSSTRYLSEYIYQVLSTSLTVGTEYYIEFWVSLGDKSEYSVKELGMYLTDDPNELTASSPDADGLYDLTPQIPNTYPSSSFYSNKNGWTKISGFFTPSTSGVRHIVIGNFDSNIIGGNPTKQTNSGGTEQDKSYYYIDDVTIAPASGCPADMDSDIPYRAYTNPGPTICKNTYNNYYTAPATPGATSYTWTSSSPYLLIEGQSSITTPASDREVSIQASQAGNFAMQLVANTPCGSTAASNPIYVQVNSCGGGFLVSPNPTSNEFKIELVDESQLTSTEKSSVQGTESADEDFTFRLYNKKQELVAKAKSKKNKTTVDVRHLPRGTYHLQIYYKEAIEQRQIIIE